MHAAPRIVATATAVPPHTATQEEVKARLRELLPLDARRLEAALSLFDNTAVERRHSVYPIVDFGRPRTLGEISTEYREHALGLGRDVAQRALIAARVAPHEIDLVVSVSCTGIMIPSLDAHLVDDLGLRRDVRRLPLTELGCSGGAAALARAHDFLRGFPAARVLVVAVELPSLSLQRGDVTPANLVATALFGDGAAAAVLAGGDVDSGPGLRVLDTLAHIFPRSTGVLGFDLRDDGFHSVLSKEIPALLKTEIAAHVRALAARAGLAREDLSFFVLHPGGRKILGVVEDELALTRADTQLSWDVLRDCGNQSSASVLFVLDETLSRRRPAPGARGLLAAFGPGLSVELLLLEAT
ncbi:MAG TPA: 3-oxoacyl-[acyl-carrier-protein] synthase III C-terminal domain-containing protein [Polyangia bacterium]|jgi:alkylresorcinol/alkylpyrone synthase|nr:3-oxoacyl-[acyl-carrier-protein] synthase III C-terminal domain-containing protein [Polyangia bacterium]